MPLLSSVARSEQLHDRLLSSLLARQNHATAGWGYHRGQGAVEPTCLALLALRNYEERPNPVEIKPLDGYRRSRRIQYALERFEHQQNPNGSWPAFQGDDQTG